MDNENNIAITIQNMVQFYSMKNGIDALLDEGYTVHIYVPQSDDNTGFGEMFDTTFNYLISLGYEPLRTANDDIIYKILLEPYPMDFYIKVKYKYRLKYKYSLLSAKPNLVYKPENNVCYDAILCYGLYEASFLKAFSNIELMGNLKYLNLEKMDRPSTSKPVLLYLPTYGNVSSLDSIAAQLQKLKSKYYIITKFHHGTSFLREEKSRIDLIKDISDEYYDHKIELAQLLSKVDVVLSDNSGSIFEALYAKKPVAIYCENVNNNKIGNFNTTQFQLVQNGYIPYTNIANNIAHILDQALSTPFIDKQLEIRNKLFYFPENPISEFVQIIKKYLNNEIDTNYKAIHDILINNYEQYMKDNTTLQNILSQKNVELTNLRSQIQSLSANINSKNILIEQYSGEINEQNLLIEQYKKDIVSKNLTIHYYEQGKLYKLSRKIYKIYHKIKRSK